MAGRAPPDAVQTPSDVLLKDEGDVKDESDIKDEDESDIFDDDDALKIEKRDSSPSDSQVTPSESASGHNGSKRTTRKSTLTQQQKNQKRQRATQDQLNTLEVEFSRNPTPNAAVRERIATEINMTERSVQIWFQNR